MTIMQADVGIAAWKACSAILILKVHKHFWKHFKALGALGHP
jgi:hypothetical protein